jgi:26S proteasome regulatory subunit T2
VAPLSKCRLRLLKLERVKDYLLMEEEFVANQEWKMKEGEQSNLNGERIVEKVGEPNDSHKYGALTSLSMMSSVVS